MKASFYESEDLLQGLQERYPDLLEGEQMNEGEPRRWLLVSREFAIPDDDGSAGRWSLDHLFVDQEGVPTLVEVKRSSDTRIRREVVGQMLDYAANAVRYWPLGRIQAQFEATCEVRKENGADLLGAFLGHDPDTEEPVDVFWLRVKTNLQAGRIRMVFVADLIPPELKRIVEFLNEQMDPAEVLAVDVKQYTGDRLWTLVPHMVG